MLVLLFSWVWLRLPLIKAKPKNAHRANFIIPYLLTPRRFTWWTLVMWRTIMYRLWPFFQQIMIYFDRWNERVVHKHVFNHWRNSWILRSFWGVYWEINSAKKIRFVFDGESYLIYQGQFQTHIKQLEQYKELVQEILNEPIPEDPDVKDED